MARLPIPGSDDGAWGAILNDYLSQSLNTDGTLKSNIVASTNLQSASVLASSLNTPAGASNGQALTLDSTSPGGFKWQTAASPPAATTSSLGTVQLAGDLSGVATAPAIAATTNVRSVHKHIGVNVFNISDPKYGTAGLGNATQDTAALAAAVSDAVSAGSGVVYAPAGTYLINSWPNFLSVGNGLPYALRGDGKGLTKFMSYATSLSTSLTASCPTYNTGDPTESATEWGGFTIDGTNASGSASGIHWQNISSVTFKDILFQNFTTGDGMYFNNYNGWCERVTITSVETRNCLNAIRYDVQTGGYGSFDYWDVTGLYVSAGADQNAVVSEVPKNTGGVIDRTGTRFRLVANLDAGYASNSGKLFWLKGQDKWSDVAWNVNAEPSGGNTYKHTTIQMDNGSASMEGIGIFTAYYLGPCVFAGGVYQFAVAGHLAINGLTGDGTFSIKTGMELTRVIFNNPSGYATSVTSGTSWQNNLIGDVFVTIPITFTSSTTAGTAKWNVDVWSGLPAGSATIASAKLGVTISITFVHYASRWARVDVTNATIGTPIVRWV